MGKLREKFFISFLGSLLFLSACSSHTPQDRASVLDTVKQGYTEYAAAF